MPFIIPQTPSNNRSDRKAEDKRISETLQHARLIIDQHKSLSELDIKTAEATAKMINAGQILSGLLVYLTSPKSRIDDAVKSTEHSTTKDKGDQLTKTPKLPKPLLPAEKLQELEPIVKHRPVANNQDNGIDRVTVTEKPTLEKDSIPEQAKLIPEERATTIRSAKGGKGSKKDNKSGKKFPHGRTRIPATSTVSPYPTQRPPRQRPKRKSIIIRESEGERLDSEECDLEKGSATRWRPLEGSELKENIPKQLLSPEQSPREDFTSPESTSENLEESKAHRTKEVLSPERIPADAGSSPSDIVDGEDLIATADKPLAFSLPTKPMQTYVQGLLWAYAINTKVDETLNNAGMWLWRKPKTHWRSQDLLRTKKSGHSVSAPVVVSHQRTGSDEPIIEFDGDALLILPQQHCWEDVRSFESHPDFLVPWKLAEYQASEASGYQVWRHVISLLQSHLESDILTPKSFRTENSWNVASQAAMP